MLSIVSRVSQRKLFCGVLVSGLVSASAVYYFSKNQPSMAEKETVGKEGGHGEPDKTRDESPFSVSNLGNFLQNALTGGGLLEMAKEFKKKERLLSMRKGRRKVTDFNESLEILKTHIKSGRWKNIIVMSGAGISTGSGIPDFRSPGIGLYDGIRNEMGILKPESIFDLSSFKNNPNIFYDMVRRLIPKEMFEAESSASHYFIRMLDEHQQLLRHYTQNVDGLDRKTGLPNKKSVEFHGTWTTGSCTNEECGSTYSLEWMKENVYKGQNYPKCEKCGTAVKPDVVFFEEPISYKALSNFAADARNCDLLIVMGTSLQVQPFASLVDEVPDSCSRLFINSSPRESLAGAGDNMARETDESSGAYDLELIGQCDKIALDLIEELEWTEEYELLSKSKGLGETEVRLHAHGEEAPSKSNI